MTARYKTLARAALHKAMANPASYTAPRNSGGAVTPTVEQLEAGLSLTVRWHNKMKIIGENQASDAAVLEGVNRLVFSQPELDALGLALAKHAIVDVPSLSKRFQLNHREESDGPLNVYWSVIEL